MDFPIDFKTDNNLSSGSSITSLVLTGMLTWNEPSTFLHLISDSLTASGCSEAFFGDAPIGGGGTICLPTALVSCRATYLNDCPFFTVEGRSTVISPA